MTGGQRTLITVVLLALVGGGVWYYRQRSGPSSGEVEPVVGTNGVGAVLLDATNTLTNQVAGLAATNGAAAVTSAAPGTVEVPMWKQQMEVVLAMGFSDTEKARRLLAMMPGLATNAQAEVMREAVKLLDDEHFAMVEGMLLDAKTPEVLSDAIMANVYERPEKMKLPLWLRVAETENHPLREEALSVLEVYVEQDYGTDMAAWRRAVEAKLKEAETPP